MGCIKTCKLCLLLFNVFFLCLSDVCKKSDFVSRYTDCDANGSRWLVHVPENNPKCTIDEHVFPSPPATVARDCDKPCKGGMYLDKDDQKCKQCKAGTYSTGDWVYIDQWQSLPSGFAQSAEDFSSDNKKQCKKDSWTLHGGYIDTNATECINILRSTVTLYKAGAITFEYSQPDTSSFSVFQALNEHCQSYSGHYSNIHILDTTEHGEWKRVSYKIRKGSNTFYWKVYPSFSESDPSSNLLIKSIEVTNAAYTSICIPCAVGSYSGVGSKSCTPCPANSAATKKGSQECTACKDGEFSLPGSAKCLSRRKCFQTDFFRHWSACDKNGNRSEVVSYVNQSVCSDKLPDSIAAPKNLQKNITCLRCPPGTIVETKSTSKCVSCPSGQVTRDSRSCSACLANTQPIRNVYYTSWDWSLPGITPLCEDIKTGKEKNCGLQESWFGMPTYIRSSVSKASSVLRFSLDNEDSKMSVSLPNGRFSFCFQMFCANDCHLYLYQLRQNGFSYRISSWHGHTNKLVFKHSVKSGHKIQFHFVFRRSKYTDYAKARTDDHVRIYSINVTNVAGFGASSCAACEKKGDSKGCVQCKEGSYYSATDKKCIPCPAGKVLVNKPGISIDDCKACPTGLITKNGVDCVLNKTFIPASGYKYDLTNLSGYSVLQTRSTFTIAGLQYFFLYNISLNEETTNSMATCKSNSSKTGNKDEQVSAFVCRSSLIPVLPGHTMKAPVVAHSSSLGDKLEFVRQSRYSRDFWKHMNATLENNGFTPDETGLDLHMQFISPTPTPVCSNGRVTILTLRCFKSVVEFNSNETSANQIYLSRKCPLGTCDGCQFHFIMISKNVCPQCKRSDYDIFNGECVRGSQTIVKVPRRYCLTPPNTLLTEYKSCPLVSTGGKVAIVCTIVLIVLLVLMVIVFYKRNKKLQYKYMKLVEGASGELPAAESCALGHGEKDEDGDAVIVTGGSRGYKKNRFVARFKRGDHDTLLDNEDSADERGDEFFDVRGNLHGGRI